MPSIKNLISIAILAAAIACEALGDVDLSRGLQAVFVTLCMATAGLAAAVISAGRRPWAIEAAAAMRAAPRIPGKSIGQVLALAVMGWWLMLAVYVAALALTYIAERKT